LVLLLDLLDHPFHFNRLAVIDAQVVLVFLESCAHTIESFRHFISLVTD